MNRARKIVISVFILALMLPFKVYAAGCNTTPFITVILPKAGSVLCEGKTYTIRWRVRNLKKICISVLIGGHDAGNIGGCPINAQKGSLEWHIPEGFISGFGTKKARVKIYLCNPTGSYCKSREFIIKSICPDPVQSSRKSIQ